MAAPAVGKKVVLEIEKHGILLVTDPVLPSVTAIVTGETVSGSWWSHARSHEIFTVLESLEEERDLLRAKLIGKKETFIHRSLWPELFAVATSREEWQMSGLSARARALLEKVERYGAVRLDELGRGFDRKALSRAARELEERLLVHGDQLHTEKGAHAKILGTWTELARKLGVQFEGLDTASARARFEELTLGRLPWPRTKG
jgi:hypothetical protein